MTADVRDQLQKSLGKPYIVERELGGGGMSRTFVAIDTTLDRRIVVKMLPAETAASVSIERFNREIQVAARLQHPHIVPLLATGECEGLPYYTMPFVKGDSLRLKLSKSGELSINDTVHILRDIAAALAYAHGEGIVHRDIKPENVIITGGVAVVTDFGVAKAVDLAVTVGGHSETGLTSVGVALGTPAYMSPEQATADPHVDHRSDIYAFGCVAYEMLAGSSPFSGRPVQQLLAAHVQEVPEPLAKRRPTVPASLSTLVMRCLEKRPGDRIQSANELIAALDAIATPHSGTAPTTVGRNPPMRVFRRSMAAAGAVIVLAAAASIVLVLRGRASRPLQVGATTPVASTAEIEIEPAISPDGKLVAYAAGPEGQARIHLRQSDGGGRPVLLTGDLDGSHSWPRWSPDGSRILFAAKGAAYVIPALGGTPRRLFGSDRGTIVTPTWSPDGDEIAYADGSGIWIRPAEGGQPRRAVAGAPFHSLAWSPNGRLLAYIEGTQASLSNVSTTSVWVSPTKGGDRIRLTGAAAMHASPVWTAGGRSLIYVSNRDGPPDVFQQELRADGQPRGSAVRLTTGLLARTISLSANDGRMAYDVVRNRSNIWAIDVPSSGPAAISAARQVTSENQRIEGVRISHDGKWLVFDSDRNRNSDIYKVRLDGGEPVQLTSGPASDFSPVWSPNDHEIAFHSSREGNRDIFTTSGDGTGERQITSDARQDYTPDWSPDGRKLVFYGGPRGGQSGVVYTVEKMDDGRWSQARPLTSMGGAGPDSLGHGLGLTPRWSRDGKWIAYRSKGKIVMVSPEGGSPLEVVNMLQIGEGAQACAWGSGSTLYFNTRSANGRYSFWVVSVTGGTRRLLFRDDPTHRVGRWDFDTDGKRLFFTLAADESDIWVADLKP